MTKYSRKCRRGGSMAKTINVTRRNKKKRTTRKKRGGELNEETTNPMWKDISPASPNVDRNAVMKTLREANKLVDPRSNPVAPSDQDILEMIGKLDAAKKEIENGNVQLSNDEKTLLYRIAELLRYTYSRRNALGIKVPSSTGGRRKKTTRKKRGGGCVNSTCRSQPNEVNTNEVNTNEVNTNEVNTNEVNTNYIQDGFGLHLKVLRFFFSNIKDKLKNEHRVKIYNLRIRLNNIPRIRNTNNIVYYQGLNEAYNNFRIQEPELSRLFDLPDDIINLQFDNRFHDRDELINYLREKEPAIFNLLKEDALNEILANVKFISQDIPNQELDGGRRRRRRKTTKRRKN